MSKGRSFMAPALLLVRKLQSGFAQDKARTLQVPGAAFVVFAALAVHAAGGF
jgi:hypothetical protein